MKKLSSPSGVEDGEVDVIITDNVEAMLVAGKNVKLFAVALVKLSQKMTLVTCSQETISPFLTG